MDPLWFAVVLGIVAILAGTTASVIGFGVGSLLTPYIAARYGTDVAVAAVALPHLAGGMVRGWRLRDSVDRDVLRTFGVISAIGGLVGALVFARVTPLVLTRVLGALLLITAITGITGWNMRWRPHGRMVWALGALSGFFGGVVGNQGGLRAAGLVQLRQDPMVFVATSTVIGVMIDLVRTPIYMNRAGAELGILWPFVAIGIAGVVIGTLAGEGVLRRIPRERFVQVVSLAIGILGLWFIVKPA
jgi:uncharacterized protein